MFKIGGISRQLRATENRFFLFPVVVFVAVVLAVVAVLFVAVALVAVEVIFRICKTDIYKYAIDQDPVQSYKRTDLCSVT